MKIRPLLKRFEPLYKSKGLRNIVLVGGRHSAKSWAIAEAIVFYMLTYCVRIMCTRMVQLSIKQSSKKLIEDTIHRYGLISQFTITRDYIRCNATGAEVNFVGLADLNSVRSLEGYGICWVEEAQAITQAAAEALLPTIRKSGSIIFWSLNPIYETDWVSREFLGAVTPPNTKVIHVSILDLPRDIIPSHVWDEAEHMRTANEARYRHVYLGEYADSAEARIMPMVLLQTALARTSIPEGPWVAGIDIGGGGDPSKLTIRQGDYIHGQWGFDLDDPQLLGNALAGKIKEIMPKGFNILYDEGGIGWAMGAILRALLPEYTVIGVNFGGAPVWTQSKARNRRAEMYQKCADHMRSMLSLKGCDGDLIRQAASISCWETTAGLLQLEDKDGIKKRIGRSPDDIDSLVLTYAIPLTEITPAYTTSYGNYTPSGSWMD